MPYLKLLFLRCFDLVNLLKTKDGMPGQNISRFDYCTDVVQIN